VVPGNCYCSKKIPNIPKLKRKRVRFCPDRVNLHNATELSPLKQAKDKKSGDSPKGNSHKNKYERKMP